VRIDTWRTGPRYGLEEVQYLRSGEFVRGVTRRDGLTRAGGGNRQAYFIIEKESPESDFVILDYGPRPDFDEAARINKAPLFAAFCGYETKIFDYVSRPDVEAVSACEAELDGRDVIDVVTQVPGPEGIIRCRFWFLPNQSWALAGCEIGCKGDEAAIQVWIETRVRYDTGNPPKIKSLELFTRSSEDPSKRRPVESFEIAGFEFKDTPPDEFRVTAFGLEEPTAPIGGCR
jgi:hypothetical protein